MPNKAQRLRSSTRLMPKQPTSSTLMTRLARRCVKTICTATRMKRFHTARLKASRSTKATATFWYRTALSQVLSSVLARQPMKFTSSMARRIPMQPTKMLIKRRLRKRFTTSTKTTKPFSQTPRQQ